MAVLDKLRRGRRVTDESASTNPRPGLGGALAGTVDPGPGRDLPPEPGEKRGVTGALSAGGTGTARVLTRLSSAALIACVACGPAAIAWRVTSPAPAPVSASASGQDTLRVLSRRSVAAEAAVAWTTVWLQSSQQTGAGLQKAYPHLATAVRLPKTASQVSEARVVDAVASAPGVWSVTVSARVTPAGGTAVTRYFQIPVAVDGESGAVRAHPMAQPAVVAGPVASPATESLGYIVAVAAESTVGTAVSAGLDALLTGRGDLTRYTTPGVDLLALTAPYTAVSVVDIRADRRAIGVADNAAPAEGQTLHVAATVMVADGKTRIEDGLSAAYPLTLTARGGRWEITAIDRSLIVTTGSNNPSSPPASPSTTPSPTK